MIRRQLPTLSKYFCQEVLVRTIEVAVHSSRECQQPVAEKKATLHSHASPESYLFSSWPEMVVLLGAFSGRTSLWTTECS